MHKVVIIGGAGDMAGVAVRALLARYDECRVLLADFDLEKAERAAASCGTARVDAAFTDIFDPRLLRETLRGADLAMNCTGPYYRTGRPVLEACIDEAVDYIDLGDDDESATALLELDKQAREAGITALICCGIAPGLVNVIAAQLASGMDEVESVDLAWVTGSTKHAEEGGGGAAVIEHMVHACMGECMTVRQGERVAIPSFRLGHDLVFPDPLGACRVFELGHAETATMPRFLPGVRTVRTMGALRPNYLNGVFRGVARQVVKGSLSMREAVDALMRLDAGKPAKGLRLYAGILQGVIEQLWRREMSGRDLLVFLREVGGKPSGKSVGGIMVAVEGKQNGKHLRLHAAQASYQGGGEGDMDMDQATGIPLAVFASLLLEGIIEEVGVLAPEGCVEPEGFFRRLREAQPIFEGLLEVGEENA
jgi:saccharopine dehydrogenase-like NADP-dependent oxidoreductase